MASAHRNFGVQKRGQKDIKTPNLKTTVAMSILRYFLSTNYLNFLIVMTTFNVFRAVANRASVSAIFSLEDGDEKTFTRSIIGKILVT